jgi:cephalosporin hydroxylase
MIGFDQERLRFRARHFANRAINFVRPKPRSVPLKVEDVLRSTGANGLVEKFIDFYYQAGTAPSLNYQGVEILKNPCDLWMTIELFQKLRPTAVIETGTHFGGSAIYYADMLRLFQIPSQVITIDFNPKWNIEPESRGIASLVGYSTDAKIVEQVRQMVQIRQQRVPGHVIAILDADHSRDGVLAELRAIAPMVTVGSYVIVEDTIVNGHPTFPSHGPGPWEAVQDFLKEADNFELDRGCQKFLLTYNLDGWLKKIR